MGLFDSFFGKSQKRDIQAGKTSADAAAKQGYDTASSTLQSGKDEAAGYINQGMSQGADAIRTGYSDANAAIDQYYGQAQGSVDDALSKIEQNYEYYINQGRGAQDRFNAAMGRSGADARTAFNQDYNQGYGEDSQYTYDMLARQAAARDNAAGGFSGGFSGRGFRAVSDAYQKQYQNDKNTYLDRLERASSRGQDATNQLSGFQSSAGNTKASLYASQGNQKSSNFANQGNSLADLYYKGNSALANNAQSAANQQSQYDYSYGQGQADRNTSYSNALASSRSTGWNNLINIAGTAAKAVSGTNLANLFNQNQNQQKKTG